MFPKVMSGSEADMDRILIDYSRADQCEQESFGYICYKCGECGRKFEDGFMVDDGGTTVSDEHE